MGVSVEISPNVLAWIGQQISPNTDAKITSLLKRWTNKEEIPTPKTIQQVSRATHIPFGYFFLKNPPQEECGLVHCRTINSVSVTNQSREFIDVYNTMSNAQNWMSEYNRDVLKWDPLPFVGRFTENTSPMKIANDIRQEIEMDEDFFAHIKHATYFNFLREKISELGILVMKNGVVGNNTHRELNIEEFRAFTLIDQYAPLIFINSTDTDNGKIFSLIHELAHIWIGANSLFNDHHLNSHVSKIEQTCNAVAAEILVPVSIFKKEWNILEDNPSTKIANFANVFPCSELVIARRALDLRFIEREVYENIAIKIKKQFEDYQRARHSKSGGGNFYKNLETKWDKRFIMALNSSTKSGDTPYIDAFRLTGLKIDTFHKLVAQFNQRQVNNS